MVCLKDLPLPSLSLLFFVVVVTFELCNVNDVQLNYNSVVQ